MKKTFILGLMVAALGFTACSSDYDLSVSNDDNIQKKGMVLRATVEQTADSRAAISDEWKFAFATSDKVSVTNTAITDTYYTFTNDGTQFKSEDAQATETDATWYAYFPSNVIDLTSQSGAKADVANMYALAGSTETATTGKEGLTITMSPKVAILVINNQKGSIDINVKNSSSTWVSGLAANADGFTVSTATSEQSLLSATEIGTYYVAVPAGVQLAVKDGDKTIKSTNGLTAGKYYNLTLIGYGKAYATGPNCDVNWVQLWENGPKFAEYNVGAANNKAEDYGGYYAWGGSQDQVDDHNKGSSKLSGDNDTATKLWGDKWRMPTQAELEALLDNCDVEWTTVSDVNGCKFTGKGDYKDNSIFLPAAGGCFPGGLLKQDDDGYYWPSTPADPRSTYFLELASGSPFMEYTSSRSRGYSVRAVLAE